MDIGIQELPPELKWKNWELRQQSVDEHEESDSTDEDMENFATNFTLEAIPRMTRSTFSNSRSLKRSRSLPFKSFPDDERVPTEVISHKKEYDKLTKREIPISTRFVSTSIEQGLDTDKLAVAGMSVCTQKKTKESKVHFGQDFAEETTKGQHDSTVEFEPMKTSSNAVFSNPNDLSCGYHSFWCEIISLDPNASQYTPSNMNLDILGKNWKYILRSLLKEDADNIIHSIQEIFGIEDMEHKMFTTFLILKKAVASGDLSFGQLKDKMYPILDAAKRPTVEQPLHVKSTCSENVNEYLLDKAILKNYSTLIKKLLPSLAIPIIGALDKLYETDENKAIATEHVLKRYCMMKFISLEAIEDAKESILQQKSYSQSNLAFANTYKPVYDVIINKSLPQNLEDRESFKNEVMIALNSIKTNKRLREWLMQIHDEKCFTYGWEKIDGSLKEEDFQSVSFEILDVFYSNKVHISFKFLGFVIEENNQNAKCQLRLEKLNNVYRIALENIDDIVSNITSVKVENKIINISYLPENKEDVKTILIDQFRNIWGKVVSDNSYRQKLLHQLKENHPLLSFNTTNDILELFNNERYKDMDGLKIQVRKNPNSNNVTMVDGYVLWPKETRRLSELPNEWFTKLYGIIIRFVPTTSHVTVGRNFITNSSLYTEGNNCLSLMEEALGLLSEKESNLFYFKLLDNFRRNGGTVGDLRRALKECMKADVNENIPHIQEGLENIDDLIEETYKKWKSSFEINFPNKITTRRAFEDFFQLYGLSQMPKMNVLEFDQSLERGEINNGDQIWLWRYGSITDSYAHVGIFVDEKAIAASGLGRYGLTPQKSIVHVTARNGIPLRHVTNNETSKIKCDLVRDVVHAKDELFVVRYEEGDDISGEEIAQRALACCIPKITFYYDGFFASCETFASKVCGSTSIRNLNLQGFQAACQGGKKNFIAKHLHTENGYDVLIQKIDTRMMEMTFSRRNL